MRRIEKAVLQEWVNADQEGRKMFHINFSIPSFAMTG